MDLCNPSVIRDLLTSAGTSPQKKFGQNFLVNKHIPERIAEECADSKDRLILEIGPGLGCLTHELAMRYQNVTAIEIDKNLIPVLSTTLAEHDNVEVVNSDVMEIDLLNFVSERAHGREVSVAANLPYYITTPILMKLLESGVKFSTITVMVQSEVAARLSAPAGSSEYGAISAAIAYYGEARRLFTVTAGNFLPPPKVDSAVVRIDLYSTPKYKPLSEKLLFTTIKAAFGQRRKTLSNALGSAFGDRIAKARLGEIVTDVTGNSQIRGEKLSISDFVRLSDAIYHELGCNY